MLVTRAVFVRLLGMAVAGAGLDRAALASGLSLGDADASRFHPHVGERFTIFPAGESGRVYVRLAKVIDLPASKHHSQFAVVFHGPADAPIADGIHEFLHPALGSFSIFISPIGAPSKERCAYQACFNRLLRT